MMQIPRPKKLTPGTFATFEAHWPGIPIRELMRRWWKAHEIEGVMPPETTVTNGTVNARIDHGRWIVSCPDESCGGGIFASAAEPVFLCPNCGSPENGHVWYAVTFPNDRVAIEQVLSKRAKASNRNWKSGETVAGLLRENVAHGIGE